MSEELPEGRHVALVVIDDGRVLGRLEPFGVDTPWWQDVVPIVAAHPELVILRLLEATPAPGSIVGGEVTYLAETFGSLGSAERASWSLRPWTGTLSEDEWRVPWASLGGPAADLEWVGSHVKVIGPPSQYKTWNLSSVWSIPTSDGEVWLKCVPTFLQHEAAVLELLSGHAVPRVLAAEGHRILLAAMPGEDGYGASLEERKALIDVLVGLQLDLVDRTSELLGLGVPDRRWPALLEAASSVVDRRLPRHEVLGRLLETAEERVAQIDACGLPDVLVHGDAHGGNARIGEGAGRGVWFDWGDSRLGNPLLDVAVLERPRNPYRDQLMDHWMGAWKAAYPECDPHRAWPLIRPLAALGDAVVYQGFLDRIEASERCYHEGDVIPCLERAAEFAKPRRLRGHLREERRAT